MNTSVLSSTNSLVITSDNVVTNNYAVALIQQLPEISEEIIGTCKYLLCTCQTLVLSQMGKLLDQARQSGDFDQTSKKTP